MLARAKHIIETLIEERAPKLSASPVWPVVRPPLYALLNYGRACSMADTIGSMGGHEALEHISRELVLQVQVSGLERVPREGRLIIIANHPTGIADGIALFDAVKGVRPDVVFYANSDAHRVCPRFDDILIPVEWVEAKRTRERTRTTLAMTKVAMEAERALAVFPAGRLARRGPDGVLTDKPWMPTALSVARKYDAPVLPVHVAGPWATLFHLFDKFSDELRDMTLFHELLNKTHRPFQLIIGPVIPVDRLDPDAGVATLALKTYVETVLPHHPDQPFA